MTKTQAKQLTSRINEINKQIAAEKATTNHPAAIKGLEEMRAHWERQLR